MGAAEVTAFLTALAVRERVAASTQNQALNALLFLYREIIGVALPWLDDLVRAKRPQHLPTVLTRDEVRAVIERLDGVPRLMALLLYGAGLRLLECCRLRIKDVDFAMNQITIRDGKGGKDRMTMFPGAVGISGNALLCRPGHGSAPPSSSARVRRATRRPRGRAQGRYGQERDVSHVQAFICDAPAGRRSRTSAPFRSCWATGM
jgi:integrase